MTYYFDRRIYFDTVRPMFGELSQEQVNGQEFLLRWFEKSPQTIVDLRLPAYELATTKHETASTMLPIEEYGKGEGQPYGVVDPETGHAYYGRGDVQLTWRGNYAIADEQLSYEGDESLEWNPSNALKPDVAARVMDRGMREGWFRDGHDLYKYFNEDVDDPYNAREIINGDKDLEPEWANGDTVGTIVARYYTTFRKALTLSLVQSPDAKSLTVRVIVPKGIQVVVEEGIG